MTNNSIDGASLLGTKLSLIDQTVLLRFIGRAVERDEKRLILSGNIYSFNLAYEHSWLRDCLNRADVVRLDGAGVRWGARLLGYKTPPRMTWADFAWRLAAFAEEHGYTLYFLGGREGVALEAAERLRERYPRLHICGVHHGYFDKTPGSAENSAVLQAIEAADPDILIVGFGMPLQERWLSENWTAINARTTLTGGAVFDYISGELKRAPKWMTNNGMEWLGRLLIEPRRLWRRYLIGNPLFIYRVLKQRFGILNVE